MNRVFLGYGLELSPDGMKDIDEDIIDTIDYEMNSLENYYWGPVDSYNDTNWFFGKIIEYVDEGSFKPLSGITNGRNRVTEEDVEYLDEKLRELSPHSYGHVHYGYYLIYTTFD